MPKPLRWGLLSTANINKALLGPLRAASRSELAAVASRDQAKAKAFAEEHNIPKAYGSYEALLHDAGAGAWWIPTAAPTVREALTPPRLERAIGVIYLPETELQSHYFHAVLPEQFDEYIWFDETSAVAALGREVPRGVPDTYPFGL